MKPLLITSGEPAGIGPDLCLGLAGFNIPLVVMGDRFLLKERAKQLNLSVDIQDYAENTFLPRHSSSLSVIHIPLREPCTAGKLNKNNAAYVIEMLQKSTELCLSNLFSALVTAPVHKAIINEAGISFSGHTEFLAQRCETANVVMMLASDEMKVALVTTHLPLKKVPEAITHESVRLSLKIIHSELQKKFAIPEPRIFVAGLNPHAGENGYLGSEEIQIIQPVIEEFCAQGWKIQGPMSADTMFSKENNGHCDVYLAMYHDQGLSVLKYASFGRAANITLGLPIIRTSVDHGTAVALAGTQGVDNGSMHYAIQCAWDMAREKS